MITTDHFNLNDPEADRIRRVQETSQWLQQLREENILLAIQARNEERTIHAETKTKISKRIQEAKDIGEKESWQECLEVMLETEKLKPWILEPKEPECLPAGPEHIANIIKRVLPS